jgi:hypothetical protein
MAGKTHFQTPQGSGTEFAAFLQQYFPLIGGSAPIGNIFFVDSTKTGATNSSAFGRSPESPMATLAFALGSTGPTAANNGDVVVCCPGHTEAVIAGGTIATANAGVSVIGIGTGRLRPVITYTTAAAASVNITAANTYISNIVFSGVGVASVTAMINVSAADVWIHDCEIEHANATNQAVLGILTTAAASRMQVMRCHFHGSNNAGTTNGITIVGGDAIRIQDNLFVGSYSATLGAIQVITTLSTNLSIKGNMIMNQTAGSTKCVVDTITGSTGHISSNGFGVLAGTAPITAATCWWSGSPANYYSASLGSIDVIQ